MINVEYIPQKSKRLKMFLLVKNQRFIGSVGFLNILDKDLRGLKVILMFARRRVHFIRSHIPCPYGRIA